MHEQRTTTVSVSRATGTVYPGPGRANFDPEAFSLDVRPYSEMYPPPTARGNFAR